MEAAVARLRQHTELPIAVGFGIKTPEQAAEVAHAADAAVVGTAIIAQLEKSLNSDGTASSSTCLLYTSDAADDLL